jgi:hypothetical protein
MPGYMVHTNEILALLGDNYFVKCTAPAARDIISRRQTCTYIVIIKLDINIIFVLPRRLLRQRHLDCVLDIQENLNKVSEQLDQIKSRVSLHNELFAGTKVLDSYCGSN